MMLVLVVSTCVFAAALRRDGASPEGTLTQISVINALMLGQYDGWHRIDALLESGNFGVGTLDHLDGELVVLDGHAYQVRGDGKVLPVPPEATTPFATVVKFDPGDAADGPPVTTLRALDEHLAKAIPARNHFAAIRIDGTFASIQVRSVRRQEPPYKPLEEVARSQSVWTYENVRGTLVGIRSPDWTAGLNVPGTHWHFLSDDRTQGGHVLDCRITKATVRTQVCNEWRIVLDDSREFDALDLKQDLRKELQEVESKRGK
jgi:acetolactate decarboxylase